MNPNTSLAMIYLREYHQTYATIPGKIRLARKAKHQLMMHWQFARRNRKAQG